MILVVDRFGWRYINQKGRLGSSFRGCVLDSGAGAVEGSQFDRMCDAMRDKLAALLRSSARAQAHTDNTDKLHNGAIAPVLLFSNEGLFLDF